MMASARKVCLVTSAYISTAPRVVREADALCAAGYDVRVAFAEGPIDVIRRFDSDLLQQKPWRASIFRWSDHAAGERWAYHRSRIRHHVARSLPAGTWGLAGVMERAESRVYPELGALAAAEPADLYIGHCLEGLAAASDAARRHGVPVGYDIEDLYVDMLPPGADTEKARARIFQLEGRLVPHCSHLVAVSRPAAAAFAARYGTAPPIVVHNCHEWSERQMLDGLVRQRKGPALSLYWFSQTVGINRGIQDAIMAAGLVKYPVQIHLQGSVSEDVKRELLELASGCGIASALHFHEPAPPGELLSRAAEHDVGLALEQGHTRNNLLTVSNKLLLYLTAGLAAAASDTDGQRDVLQTCPKAGLLYRAGDVASLAAQLNAWCQDPAVLGSTKRAALDAARTTWNYEREGRSIVSSVERIIGFQRERRKLG